MFQTLLRLKTQQADDITYSATISANKKIITIDPADNFTLGQTVYVALAAVEDASQMKPVLLHRPLL